MLRCWNCPHGFAVSVSHIRVRSSLPYWPVANLVPSGLNATATTLLLCFTRWTSLPEGDSHSRAASSPSEAVNKYLPCPGLNVTDVTLPSCFRGVPASCCVAVCQIRASPAPDLPSRAGPTSLRFPLPVAKYLPSGLKATLITICLCSRDFPTGLPVMASQSWALPWRQRTSP